MATAAPLSFWKIAPYLKGKLGKSMVSGADFPDSTNPLSEWMFYSPKIW